MVESVEIDNPISSIPKVWPTVISLLTDSFSHQFTILYILFVVFTETHQLLFLTAVGTSLSFSRAKAAFLIFTTAMVMKPTLARIAVPRNRI